jgi:enoyl-CoA hydratase
MTAILSREIAGGVLTLTLNRPAVRNALSGQLLNDLRLALADAAADNMRAVVLTGAAACFSAGADISELVGTTEDLIFDDRMSDIVRALRTAPFVAIAAIEGPCIGAGFDLACACDARVIAPSAFFELPSVRLGLLYNPLSIARMQRILPAVTARRLLLLGERIEGGEAVAAGIATHRAPNDRTLAVAVELAGRLVGNPRALIETKRLLTALEDGAADLSSWQLVRQELLGSSERQAALAAAKSRLCL